VVGTGGSVRRSGVAGRARESKTRYLEVIPLYGVSSLCSTDFKCFCALISSLARMVYL
jgi:hypothetical protein